MPVIVDPDQDADHIRFQFQRIHIPTIGQLKYFMSTDAAIEYGRVKGRVSLMQLCRGQKSITVARAHGLVRLLTILASAWIGDGVTLEKNNGPVSVLRGRF